MGELENTERIRDLYNSLLDSSRINNDQETRRIYKELVSRGEPVSSIIGTIEMSGLSLAGRQPAGEVKPSAEPEEASHFTPPFLAAAATPPNLTGLIASPAAAGRPGPIPWSSRAARSSKTRGVIAFAIALCALLGLTNFMTTRSGDERPGAAPNPLSALNPPTVSAAEPRRPAAVPAVRTTNDENIAAVPVSAATSGAAPAAPEPDLRATTAAPGVPRVKEAVAVAVQPPIAASSDAAPAPQGPVSRSPAPDMPPVKEATAVSPPAASSDAASEDAALGSRSPAPGVLQAKETVAAAVPPPAASSGAAPAVVKPDSPATAAVPDAAPAKEATAAPSPAARPVYATSSTETAPSGFSDKPLVPRGRVTPLEAATLIEHGDSLFAAGDVASARLFYERAANGGDAGGAFRLGETYDSLFLAQVGLSGMRGDPDTAVRWYRRAGELGSTDASIVLKNMGNR